MGKCIALSLVCTLVLSWRLGAAEQRDAAWRFSLATKVVSEHIPRNSERKRRTLISAIETPNTTMIKLAEDAGPVLLRVEVITKGSRYRVGVQGIWSRTRAPHGSRSLVIRDFLSRMRHALQGQTWELMIGRPVSRVIIMGIDELQPRPGGGTYVRYRASDGKLLGTSFGT